jgi:hypothetical protein
MPPKTREAFYATTRNRDGTEDKFSWNNLRPPWRLSFSLLRRSLTKMCQSGYSGN